MVRKQQNRVSHKKLMCDLHYVVRATPVFFKTENWYGSYLLQCPDFVCLDIHKREGVA
jgi:hypothetical protein